MDLRYSNTTHVTKGLPGSKAAGGSLTSPIQGVRSSVPSIGRVLTSPIMPRRFRDRFLDRRLDRTRHVLDLLEVRVPTSHLALVVA